MAAYGLAPTTAVAPRDLAAPSAVLTREQWAVACQIGDRVSARELAMRRGASLSDTVHCLGSLVRAGLCVPVRGGRARRCALPAVPPQARPDGRVALPPKRYPRRRGPTAVGAASPYPGKRGACHARSHRLAGQAQPPSVEVLRSGAQRAAQAQLAPAAAASAAYAARSMVTSVDAPPSRLRQAGRRQCRRRRRCWQRQCWSPAVLATARCTRDAAPRPGPPCCGRSRGPTSCSPTRGCRRRSSGSAARWSRRRSPGRRTRARSGGDHAGPGRRRRRRPSCRATAASLTPVINATGVLVHTNLGRAPLCARRGGRAAAPRRAPATSSSTWTRGPGARSAAAAPSRRCGAAVPGAQAAGVVNNNAAALVLAATALAGAAGRSSSAAAS